MRTCNGNCGMTPEESEVIKAALHYQACTEMRVTGTGDWTALMVACRRLHMARDPKPRYVVRHSAMDRATPYVVFDEHSMSSNLSQAHDSHWPTQEAADSRAYELNSAARPK